MIQTKKISPVPYCICGWLMGNVMGALMTWSYFRESLAELFPSWSAGQLSMVFSLHNIVVVCVMLLTGQLLKKVSPRILAFLGGCMLLIGFGLFPYLPVDNPQAAYVMLVICFTCIAASASGLCGIIMTSVFPVWVPEHMGLVAGIAVTSCGIAPFYLGAYCGALIPGLGVLRAVQILGITVFIMVMITLPWCRFPGPVDHPEPPTDKKNAVITRDYQMKEVLMSPLFWVFFLFCALNRGAGLIMTDLGGTIATAFGAATIMGLIFSPANGVASLLGGVSFDRLGQNKTLLISATMMVLCGILLVVGNLLSSILLLLLGLIFGGASYGMQMTVAATSTRTLFGNKFYGQNYSFVNSSIAIAAACGVLAGFILDMFSGAFGGVFVFVLILGVAAFLLALLVIRLTNNRGN